MLRGCDVARNSSALPGGRRFPAAQVPAGAPHSSPLLLLSHGEARSRTKRLANVLGFSPSSGVISSASPHPPPATLYPQVLLAAALLGLEQAGERRGFAELKR